MGLFAVLVGVDSDGAGCVPLLPLLLLLILIQDFNNGFLDDNSSLVEFGFISSSNTLAVVASLMM